MLADERELEQSFEKLISVFGRIDVLANNAGTGVFGRMPDASEFDRIFAVNVRAMYLLSLLAVPYLTKVGGTILNIGSSAVERPYAGELVYLASKGAVAALTKGMAASWGKQGVSVNLIQPGVIPSEFLETAGLPAAVATAMHQSSEDLNALPTTGEVNDIAQAAIFLASDQARFIAGATLNVDGGFSLGAVRS